MSIHDSNTNGNSTEKTIFGMALGTVAVLALLCILALTVLFVARAIVAPKEPTDDKSDLTPSGDDDDTDPNRTDSHENHENEDSNTKQLPVSDQSSVLEQTADYGQNYVDSMVFFGESTTAHLRSRGVLSDGKQTKQVWADASNTMMLSLEILSKKIIYPEIGEEMTIEQAVSLKRPRYVVLSFGVNGLSGFAANQRLYSASYAKLIRAIQAASPETTVILQTVYPVAEQYANAAAVNEKIELLNSWLPQIAKDNGAYLVDTASCLKDQTGMLRAEFAETDGLHLKTGAYQEILAYLRTHGCPGAAA